MIAVPLFKAIKGNAVTTKFVRQYLFKNDRALERDFLNVLDRDYKGRTWAQVMDETRHAVGNDVPAKEGAKVRTYEHLIVSLDPKDGDVPLDDFRDFITEWAAKWFDSPAGVGRFEVAIAYHDDNSERVAAGEKGILHAHLVINNTELETFRRISGLMTTKRVQAMRADLQQMALDRGWHGFASNGESHTADEMQALGLRLSRGKRLDRYMDAMESVMSDETMREDVAASVAQLLEDTYEVPKMIPETFLMIDREGTGTENRSAAQPSSLTADPSAKARLDASSQSRPKPAVKLDKDGNAYTTLKFSNGKTMRMIVPRWEYKSQTMAERHAEAEQGWSWKGDIKDRVDVALRVAQGPADFAGKLAQLGVTVNYNRQGEVVYHHAADPDARKVKGSTLGHAYTAKAVEDALSEKYASRRQRAHGLRDRERWMTSDERSAAMAIAKAAPMCSRDGTELIHRLQDAIGQSHGGSAAALAEELGIAYGKPAPKCPTTPAETIEAHADERDEMGYGGGALNNPTAASTRRGNRERGESAGGRTPQRGR